MLRVRKNFSLIFTFLFVVVLLFYFVLPVFALQWPNSPAGTPFRPSCPPNNTQCTPSTLNQMIKYFYEWGVVLGAVTAFVMLVVAGIQYISSAGDPGKIKDARNRIGSAIGGLILLLSSFLILNILNPELTTLRIPYFPPPGPPQSPSNPPTTFPQGPCAKVMVYSENYYQGTVDEILANGSYHNLSFEMRRRGSIKVFSFKTNDTSNLNNIVEGGICIIALYNNTQNCSSNINPVATIYSGTPYIGELYLSQPIKCVIVTPA